MGHKLWLMLFFLISSGSEEASAGTDSDATHWRVVSEYCVANCKSGSKDPYNDVIDSLVTMTSDDIESNFTDDCHNHVVFSAGKETREQLMSRFSSIYGTAFIKENAERFTMGHVVDTITATCVDDRLRYEIAFLFNVSGTSADVLVEDGKVLHLVRVAP